MAQKISKKPRHSHKWVLGSFRDEEYLEHIRVLVAQQATFVCECGKFKTIVNDKRANDEK